MPFLAGPAAPRPKESGTCSICTDTARVWHFAEQEVSLNAGFSAVLGYAICQACIEVVLTLADEDFD